MCLETSEGRKAGLLCPIDVLNASVARLPYVANWVYEDWVCPHELALAAQLTKWIICQYSRQNDEVRSSN
jgi:hypothetical protein